jgi:hypothetical protein
VSNTKNNKIISFRSNTSSLKKMNRDIFEQNISKKDWLDSKINNIENTRHELCCTKNDYEMMKFRSKWLKLWNKVLSD